MASESIRGLQTRTSGFFKCQEEPTVWRRQLPTLLYDPKLKGKELGVVVTIEVVLAPGNGTAGLQH